MVWFKYLAVKFWSGNFKPLKDKNHRKFLSLDKRKVASFDFGKDRGQRVKRSRHLHLTSSTIRIFNMGEIFHWWQYYFQPSLYQSLSFKRVIVRDRGRTLKLVGVTLLLVVCGGSSFRLGCLTANGFFFFLVVFFVFFMCDYFV